MFCPNCGTQNPETAQTCSKCNFNLKGAAAPKFKGTMLMMNQPGGAQPPAPPAPPRPATGAVPSAGPSKLKGTMVGVAPPVPMPGAPAAPAAPVPTPAPMAAPPQEAASFNPTGQQVNPLGGTMVADNATPFSPPPAPGGFGSAPPPADPYGAPPAQAQGFGGPPPADPYGAPPAQQGFGGPPPGDPYGVPPQQGYGGPPQGGFPGAPPQQGFPPPQQDYGAQAQAGFNQAAQGIGQAADQMGNAFGGAMQQAGFGGAPMQPGPGAPMQGPGGEVNTTMPLILGIVSTLCCGLAAVCGIVAIVFSMQAKTLAQQGQLDAARAKVGTAKLLGFIGIGLGVVVDLIVVILQVVARH